MPIKKNSLFIIFLITYLSGNPGHAQVSSDAKDKYIEPETVCKNSGTFKNFLVIVKFTRQEDGALIAAVTKQHVMMRAIGKVTSFPLMKPFKAVKTETLKLRKYQNAEPLKSGVFELLMPLDQETPTKIHHGTLNMPLEGKSQTIEMECADS